MPMHSVCKRCVARYCNIMQNMSNVGILFSLFNVIETPNVYTIGRSIVMWSAVAPDTTSSDRWKRGRSPLPRAAKPLVYKSCEIVLLNT